MTPIKRSLVKRNKEKNHPTGRQIKAAILTLLQQDDFEQALVHIGDFPHRRAVNPLFSFFYHQDRLIRWRAITAMGVVVAQLAQIDLESARVVMRRLMWNLNDESGGIGWGSPEAMGEIIARSDILANEFAHILISYISEDMNFLEHEGLQRGVLWGLARASEVRPKLFRSAGPFLAPFLNADDPLLRGLAAKTAVTIGDRSLKAILERMALDHTPLCIFSNDQWLDTTVADLARMVSS